MKSMMKSKGGSIPDLIFFIVVMFVLAFVIVVLWVIFQNIDENFQASSGISQEGKDIESGIKNRFVGVMNNVFLIGFFGFFIAIVVGAYFIRTHPAIFWLSIPILAFIIFIGAIYANFWSGVTTGTMLESAASDFPIIQFIFNNYVYFITAIVLIVTAVLFMKPGGNI